MTDVRMFDYLDQYHTLAGEMNRAIERVLESGRLILGEEVRAFEEEFVSFLGNGHAVGVGNGTDAIVVALRSLGIGRGDEVVTVANTAVPTVSAIRETGATPVFCDVNEDTCLIDIDRVGECLSERTKAVVAVHLYGNAVDITELRNHLEGADVAIVEDCAQAHGAAIRGQRVGLIGDVGTFSFYPTKNLGAYGDGGLCVTRDAGLASKMRSIRMYGFEQAYDSEREGVNSRLDEIQAAILRVKLPHLGSWVERRREIAALYDAYLPRELDRVRCQTGVEHAYHLYVVKVQSRDLVRQRLDGLGIPTGVHYPIPIHRMNAYRFLDQGRGALPVTEKLSRCVLSLPMYPELPDDHVLRVCEAMSEATAGCK